MWHAGLMGSLAAVHIILCINSNSLLAATESGMCTGIPVIQQRGLTQARPMNIPPILAWHSIDIHVASRDLKKKTTIHGCTI